MRGLVFRQGDDADEQGHPVGVVILGADFQAVNHALGEEHFQGFGYAAGSGGGFPHGVHSRAPRAWLTSSWCAGGAGSYRSPMVGRGRPSGVTRFLVAPVFCADTS